MGKESKNGRKNRKHIGDPEGNIHPAGGGIAPHDAQYRGTIRTTIEELRAIAQSAGVEPYEVVCRFAAGDHKWLGYKLPIPPELRYKAAAEAAEYLYPKRKAIEVTGAIGGSLESYMGIPRSERRLRIEAILSKLGIAGHLPTNTRTYTTPTTLDAVPKKTEET